MNNYTHPTAIIQSAFKFENGTRIIVYTSNGEISAFICDESWKPRKKPYATSSVFREKWPADIDYHKDIRSQHGEAILIEAHSTPL